ncbi:MAG: hypothetical protein WC196_05635 [Bacilli bacterium]
MDDSLIFNELVEDVLKIDVSDDKKVNYIIKVIENLPHWDYSTYPPNEALLKHRLVKRAFKRIKTQ